MSLASCRFGKIGAVDPEDQATVELLERWHGGEEHALDELLQRNLPWIRAHVRKRLGERLRAKAETEDYVQDAVVEMLRYGPRFMVHRRAQFRALLAQIAENVLRGKHVWFKRQRRAVSRERAMPNDSVLDLDAAAQSVTTPSEAAMRHERDLWIRLALELLAPADREAVLLREWEGLPFAEIASRLEISEDAARMRFRRALGRLARVAKQLRDGELDQVLAAGPQPPPDPA